MKLQKVAQSEVKSVNKVINDFILHCMYEKRLSNKTIMAYRVDLMQLENHLRDRYSLQGFEMITKDMLKRYLYEISEYKPKTIKRKMATVKALFSFYEFENENYINPMRKVKVHIRNPRILPTIMSDTEVKMIIQYFYQKRTLNQNQLRHSYSYITQTRDIAIIELLFATGIRVSELCGLRCEDVDLLQGNIKVNGKGSKERVIQICSMEVLASLREYQSLTKSDTFFFINRLGNKISAQSIRLMIKHCIENLKISKHITPHTFRHTFATLLLEENVDIRYIQNLLGHSSIVTTQIYTHVTASKQKEILLHKHPRNKFNLDIR